MWVLDPSLTGKVLRCRLSQKKYVVKTPTSTQSRIEVCKFAQETGPGRVNLQIMRCLIPRLHDPKVLVDMLRQELDSQAEALTSFDAAESFCLADGLRGARILQKMVDGFSLQSEVVQSSLRRAMRRCARPHSFVIFWNITV